MNLRILGLVALLLLSIVIAPTGSWSQTVTIDIGSGTCTLSGSSPLNLSNPYTCGNITITPKGVGSANVTALDGNSDILRFLNATITANQPVSNMHIVVTGTFVPGPSTTTAPVYYRTSASGNFSTTNVGNVITVKSTVTDVATSTTRQMFQQQDTDGDANGNSISLPTSGTLNTQWVPPPHLSSNRILALDFWFTLKTTGDKLNLSSIVLESKATQGGDDDQGEEPGHGGDGKQPPAQQGPAQQKGGGGAEKR